MSDRLRSRILTRRFLLDAARVAGAVIFVFVWWLLTFNDYQHDARAYWTSDLDHLYARARVGGEDAYLYSPLFAQLFRPLAWLPWEVFAAVWAALNLGALAWLAGPIIGAALLVIPGSPVIDEVGTGNIHLLIAAAAIAGFRFPGAWAIPLLTKVTTGVGVLYFAGARRWRELTLAGAVTVGLSLASFVLAPALWLEWVEVLATNTGVGVPSEIAVIPGPVILRAALAGVVALVAGWLGWRWLVPVAVTLALPVPWSSGLSVLVAIVALWRFGLLVERRSEGEPS